MTSRNVWRRTSIGFSLSSIPVYAHSTVSSILEGKKICTILGRKQAIKYQGGHWQRFPVPVFSIPIPVPRLSSLGTRFQLRFRDCPWLEHDSESGSETAQALNSIPIPVPRLHRLRARFRVLTQESWHFGSDSRYFHLKKRAFFG